MGIKYTISGLSSILTIILAYTQVMISNSHFYFKMYQPSHFANKIWNKHKKENEPYLNIFYWFICKAITFQIQISIYLYGISTEQISPFNIPISPGSNISPSFVQTTPTYKRNAKSTPISVSPLIYVLWVISVEIVMGNRLYG